MAKPLVLQTVDNYNGVNDILTKLKTVDGANSGLDADMADGYNFDQSLKTTDSPSFANLTMTNSLTFANGNDIIFNGSRRPSIYTNGTNQGLQVRSNGTGTLQLNAENTGPVQTKNNTLDDGSGNIILPNGGQFFNSYYQNNKSQFKANWTSANYWGIGANGSANTVQFGSVDSTGAFLNNAVLNLTVDGTINPKNFPIVSTITSATSGTINLPNVNVGTSGFATALHMSTTYNAGYVQHVSIGNYRTGSGYNGGFFVGLGGNDSYPTNYWLLDYGGTLHYKDSNNNENIINFGNSIQTYQNTYTSRICGSVNSNDYFYLGTGNCRIDCTGGTARLQSDANNYMSIDSGQFTVYLGGTARFAVAPSGTKTGGTMDIDGITYGMSPMDSPRVVIEDFYLNQQVDAAGTTIMLNSTYAKMISEYGVWPNNGEAKVTSKDDNSFTISGYTGIIDIRVLGYRKDSLDYYYPVMNNLV